MRSLEISAAAASDITRHSRKHRVAMSRILVRLQEIQNDPRLLALLLQVGVGGDRWSDKFYVGEWVEQKREGRELRYLKFWEIENRGERFRVIYARCPRTDILHVLGVAPREFDYEPESEYTKRIISDYDKLGCGSP